MARRFFHSPILVLSCIAGCHDDLRDADEGWTGVATASADGTGASDSAADAPPGSEDADTGSSAGEPDTGGAKFDVSVGDTGMADGSDGLTGCTKVDFLFVIDNSGSMVDEQQNLVASVPGFVAAIEDTLEVDDFHVMVVDSDAAPNPVSSTCSPAPACCNQFCAQNPFSNCNDEPCMAGCDYELGAGKRSAASGQTCGLPGDSRYIVGGQDDLADAFACVASVGVEGNGDEKQARAAIRAVSDQCDVGGCNEGFLRDDAILVLTIISDEDDGGAVAGPFPAIGSDGDPPDWYADIVAAKNDVESSMVVLGLLGDSDLPGAVCGEFDGEQGAAPALRLRQLVELFGNHGSWASVCSPDYTPFFLDVVTTIDATCDDFRPEG